MLISQILNYRRSILKKPLFFLLVFMFLVIGGIYAQQLGLDAVIERSARAVENVLRQGTKVAILNFASPSETFSDYVIEELTGELVTRYSRRTPYRSWAVCNV